MNLEKNNTYKNPWVAEVVSLYKDKSTAKVSVQRTRSAQKYKKLRRLCTNLLVDLNHHEVSIGSKVLITPCRKLSKLKSWKVLDILSKGDIQ